MSAVLLCCYVVNGLDLQQILDRYPNGLSSIHDAAGFYQLLSSLQPEYSDDDSCEEAVDGKSIITDDDIRQATRIMYQRTAENLDEKNNDLMLSLLCYGAGDKSAFGLELEDLLQQFRKRYYNGVKDFEELLSKSLWRVQCSAMHAEKELGQISENFCINLIYKCFHLLLPKHRTFVKEVVVPEMEKCGFKQAIPSWVLY
jgi:hypothetical protein